ncbi:MAG: type II secretion system protein, partial [Candidatus Nealsonbacteria bacterium]|nr:type II secretion system protein [Candidatus Nealsonbacteria bacterium]
MKGFNKKITGFAPHKICFCMGFTLVEVLIVVTIMGLIMGIVMITVGSARDKARDAAIKANLSGMRSEGENYATDNPGAGYSGFCNDSKTMEYRNAVLAQNKKGVGCAEETDGKKWAACADL